MHDISRESKLDLTDTIKDGARLFLLDEGIRRKLILALTEDSKLHVEEVHTLKITHTILACIVRIDTYGDPQLKQ